MSTRSLTFLFACTLASPFALAQPVQQEVVQDIGATDLIGASHDGSVVVGRYFPGMRWTVESGAVEFQHPWWETTGDVWGVTGDGLTVYGAFGPDGGTQVWRWTSALGGEYLGSLSNTPGVWAGARDATPDGQILVGFSSSDTFSSSHAIVWTEQSGVVDLGTLGGVHSYATAVSDDGSVIVGNAHTVDGDGQAVRWIDGVIEELGWEGQPHDVSADGSVVVGNSFFPSGESRGIRWTAATGAQELPMLPGWTSTRAYGVSADGTVIVGQAFMPGSFRACIWTQDGPRELRQPDNEIFSGAAAVSGDGNVVVGSALWDITETLGERYCDPIPSSTGLKAMQLVEGSVVAADNDVVLRTKYLPPGVFGYYLTSRDQGDIFPVTGSQGRLCLGGFIGRFVAPGQVLNSGSSGSFQLAIDINAMPTTFGSAPVLPGETWNFQTWHRDNNPGPTSNFSDAVSVTFE